MNTEDLTKKAVFSFSSQPTYKQENLKQYVLGYTQAYKAFKADNEKLALECDVYKAAYASFNEVLPKVLSGIKEGVDKTLKETTS